MSELTTPEQIQRLSADAKFVYEELLKLAKVEDNAKRRIRSAPWYVLLEEAYSNYCKLPENVAKNSPDFEIGTIAASDKRESLARNLIDGNLIIKNRIMINAYESYQYLIFRLDSENKGDFIKRAGKLYQRKYKELQTSRTVSNSLYKQKEVLDKEKEFKELLAINRKKKGINKADIYLLTVKMTQTKKPEEINDLRSQIVMLMQEQNARDEVIAKARQQLKTFKKEICKQIRPVVINPQVMGL